MRRLEADGPPPYTGGPLSVARRYSDTSFPNFRYIAEDVQSAGGDPRGASMRALFDVDGYRLVDKAYVAAGLVLTFGRVHPQLLGQTCDATPAPLEVPVWFTEGRQDSNAMPQLVEEYAEVLHAPHKKLVWFERSEHSPSFEESEAFNELLLTEVHRYALEGGTP